MCTSKLFYISRMVENHHSVNESQAQTDGLEFPFFFRWNWKRDRQKSDGGKKGNI